MGNALLMSLIGADKKSVLAFAYILLLTTIVMIAGTTNSIGAQPLLGQAPPRDTVPQKTAEPAGIDQTKKPPQANQTLTPFRIVTTLYGIDNSTGYIVVLAKAHNVTKYTIFNAAVHDRKDGRQNGNTDVMFRFDNTTTLNAGEQYEACV